MRIIRHGTSRSWTKVLRTKLLARVAASAMPLLAASFSTIWKWVTIARDWQCSCSHLFLTARSIRGSYMRIPLTRLVLPPLVLAFAVAHAAAQTAQINRIEIVERGIFESQTKERIDAPGAATGQQNIVVGVKLVQSTTSIPAKVGIGFGIMYVPTGNPKGGPVQLRAVVVYPTPGFRNAKTGQFDLQSELVQNTKIGSRQYRGFRLVAQRWLLPGLWRFEVWQGNRKFAEQTFTMVRP
jgi:hypothetical protein